MVLEKQLLLPINLGKVSFRTIWVHHPTVRKITQTWETFKTAANLPRSGCSSKFIPRPDHIMSWETAKKTSQTRQALANMWNIEVHDYTIRKRLKKTQDFWNNVIWTVKTKMKCLTSGENQTQHLNTNTSNQLIQACFEATGHYHLTVKCEAICLTANDWLNLDKLQQ